MSRDEQLRQSCKVSPLPGRQWIQSERSSATGFRARLARSAAGVAVCCGLALSAALTAKAAAVDVKPPLVAARSTTNAPLHPVVIKLPAGTPKVATGLTNFHGQPVTVSCTTCHATTAPNIDTRTSAELDQFHQGLKYAHGQLSCLSCHNAKNYDTLRLADSRPVAFTDVMTLCSQCHGSQRRDYDMGLHGGMNGYWDLRKGGRTRNNCINCHDPHNPAFPLVRPVLTPRDRFSVPVNPTTPAAKP